MLQNSQNLIGRPRTRTLRRTGRSSDPRCFEIGSIPITTGDTSQYLSEVSCTTVNATTKDSSRIFGPSSDEGGAHACPASRVVQGPGCKRCTGCRASFSELSRH